MLLIDDILLAPARGLFWIFREIYSAAEEELASENDSIRVQLSNLYMMLETGVISEEAFDAQEKILLDRLDRLEGNDTRLDAMDESEEIPKGTAGIGPNN